MRYVFQMESDECWWGGTSDDGCAAPFTKSTVLSRDFRISSPNQTMPMYLSSHGRCIWSEEPFGVEIKDGQFVIDGENVVLEQLGSNLMEAYTAAQAKHFPPQGNRLPEAFFTKPQYNTWMQYTYNPTQEGVMRYAQDILNNGFAPGILIIDEGWHKPYGTWEFDPAKFPDPKSMVRQLHEMGFVVMLWVVPYVRADGVEFVKKYFREFNAESADQVFWRNADGKIAITEWWNGFSATFDLTKQCDIDILDGQLSRLVKECGVDGFKFDGGNLDHWTGAYTVNGPVDPTRTPAQLNLAWNEFGTRYRFHEYKDTFKGGGKRVIQRLRDRFHSWDNDGLNTLIPNAILQGLLGHPFLCPDMIGGGSWTHRDLNLPIDEELFVRMAQCSALFPMMQFSWAPWEAVSKENLAHIRAAHDLHISFADTMLRLIDEAYETGEPILRSLAYNYPGCGYEHVKDQFMLGTDVLVAPVVEKGAKAKRVCLPEGSWTGFDGKTYTGGCTLEVPVSIETLPYFTKKA